MNIPQEQQAAETSRQEKSTSAAASQRHADWISYAVAVTQQAAPTATEFTQMEG